MSALPSPAMYEERIRLLEEENQRLREALEAARSEFHAIRANAESFHKDDVAKGRALAVIAGWATDALAASAAVGEE